MGPARQWRWAGRARLPAVVAVAVVAASVGALLLAGAGPVDAANAPVPPVAGWRGSGELAVITSGRLELVGDNGLARLVNGPGVPSAPAWSPDGEWLAFTSTPVPIGASSGEAAPVSLWVVHKDGARLRRLSSPSVTVGEFAWAPSTTEEVLAFIATTTAGYSSRVVMATPSSAPGRVFGSFTGVIGFSWSPGGDALAVSYRDIRENQPQASRGVLEIAPRRGGPGRVVNTVPDGGYVDLAGWWPDGKGLLFWDDPAGSASIAADGLTLESLDLSTLKTRVLATTLVYANWLAWAPGGGTVAIVAGGNRMIWDSGKHVELCTIPAAQCRAAPLLSGRAMTLDPAWTAAGTLVYVTAPGARSPSAVFPPGLQGHGAAPYSASTVTAWYAAQRLVALPAASGAASKATELRGPGAGAHDPTPTAHGLLYVRAGGLWYLPAGQLGPVRVAGGLASPSPYGNYYGYIAWYQDFAWHA